MRAANFLHGVIGRMRLPIRKKEKDFLGSASQSMHTYQSIESLSVDVRCIRHYVPVFLFDFFPTCRSQPSCVWIKFQEASLLDV